MDYSIHSVKHQKELESILLEVSRIFSRAIPTEGKYSLDFWIEHMNKNSELLLFAEKDGKILGSTFGWEEGGTLTIAHCFVHEDYRKSGIGKALMLEEEKRAKELGFSDIVLGSADGAEEFYERLGYKGTLLVQSEIHSIEELLNFNENNKKYKVKGTNVYDGYVNQIFLEVPISDKDIRKAYEAELKGCYAGMAFGKSIKN